MHERPEAAAEAERREPGRDSTSGAGRRAGRRAGQREGQPRFAPPGGACGRHNFAPRLALARPAPRAGRVVCGRSAEGIACLGLEESARLRNRE
jgi:hypothetical protein